jgi:hypothetical protein
MSQSISYSHKQILFFSICLSLALHLVEIHFLQKQGFWVTTKTPVELPQESIDHDQILKEAFTGVDYPHTDPKANRHVSTTHLSESLASLPYPKPHLEAPKQVSNLEIPAISEPLTIHFEPPTIAFVEKIELLPNLPKEMILPTTEEQRLPHISPHLMSFAIHIPDSLPNAELFPPVSKLPETTLTFEPSWIQSKIAAPIATPVFPIVKNIPTLSELRAKTYSHSFETEVVFYEMNDEYIFALTLIPKPDLHLTPLKQNYLFLIDRSNSIQKERLNATKNAVRRALDELNKNDQFNILVFDQKIEKLSPSMLSVSTDSINKAHQFLNKIDLGSFFSQKNLNKPLFLTVPQSPKNDELFTAILITDGENLSHKSAVQGLIEEWSRMNQGKVSLFTLGMNDDSHLDILDAISNLNRGKNYTSPTYRGLKRKLLKIMKTVHSPIAKNISCNAIPRFSNGSIELFPKPNHAPHLYAGEPYTILGTTKSLDDFVLFVQARLDNQWLHIKKNISFANAKKGNETLATEIAQLKSFDYYQQYLEGKGLQCLNEAQKLLKEHELPPLFEKL